MNVSTVLLRKRKCEYTDSSAADERNGVLEDVRLEIDETVKEGGVNVE